MPSPTGSQQRTFLHLLAQIRPHWRRDQSLPARIQTLLAKNRAFGSRDRRLYRELLYTALRYLPWIDPLLDSAPDTAAQLVAWLAADLPATAAYRRALLATWPPTPPTLAEKSALVPRLLPKTPHPSPLTDAAALLPHWFRDHSASAFLPAELDALHRRAPLWLRLQTSDPAPIHRDLAALGLTAEPSALLPDALRVSGDPDLTKTDSYQRGLFEIQDLGSQLILARAALAPGTRWLDACAGAGGKTLQLARLLGDKCDRLGGPTGQVDAHDIRPAALAELATRATRAGLKNIRILPAPPADTYDGVLVDAPCSGTGTWRRAPHLKWTTTPAHIAAQAARQLALLTQLAPRVRPGGRLLYATCSLSRVENEDVIAAFLAAHPNFAPDPAHSARTLLPSEHDTDGFFSAPLLRR